jgi:hypothetical protein
VVFGFSSVSVFAIVLDDAGFRAFFGAWLAAAGRLLQTAPDGLDITGDQVVVRHAPAEREFASVRTGAIEACVGRSP